LNKTADVLSRIENYVEREMYIKKIAGEYEISEEAMYGEVLKKLSPRASVGMKITLGQENARLKTTPRIEDIDKKIIHDERFIMSLVCIDNSISKKAGKLLKPEMFSNQENRHLAEVIVYRLSQNRGITVAELMNLVSSECAGEFARIINEECHCDDNIRAIMGKIRDIDLYKTEKRQKEILELLKDENNLPEGDVDKLKLEFKDLTLKIRDIKNL